MGIMSALAAGLLGVAAAPQDASGPSLDIVTQAEPGTTLVTGSLVYRKHGVDSDCGETLQQCHLIVVPPQGGKPLVFAFKRGTAFTWALPAGDYVVAGLDRGQNGKQLGYVIHVPEGSGGIYIGDLTFDVSDYGITAAVGDDYASALHRFGASLPDHPRILEHQLMEPYGVPDGDEQVYEICSGEWGVSCNIARQGLVPTLPTKSRGPSYVIKEREPRFAWTPTKTSGMTYDFALFDTVYYHSVPYRAHLIAYEQDIAQPSWTLREPLQPGQAYFWSVRLRHGRAVSTWSTQSNGYVTGMFGTNLILAEDSWFRFDLPVARP
jgi:hypothetical protein